MSLDYSFGTGGNKSVGASEAGFQHERQSALSPLIESAGTDRICIPLPDGSKQSVISHDDPETHRAPNRVVGNYGLMPKGDVVYIDVDDPEEFPRPPDEFPWVQESVHGEGYHIAVESQVRPGNAKTAWGEVRAENQYIVGPGSRVDHDSECDDCGHSGVGVYQPLSVGPLPRVGDEFWADLGIEITESDGVEELPEVETVEAETDFSIRDRIAKAKTAKHGEQFTALWEGRYRDAGYDDRSNAEMELLLRLAFWMEKDEQAMRTAMQMTCSEHSRTQSGEPRKWSVRDGLYRNLTVKKARQEVDGVYDPGSIGVILPFEEKSTVSYVTKNKVLDALQDLMNASTKEIVEHDEVDRGERQVRNALTKLEEDGWVAWERDGRQVYYYLTFPDDGSL